MSCLHFIRPLYLVYHFVFSIIKIYLAAINFNLRIPFRSLRIAGFVQQFSIGNRF